ncbi:MAG TPA: sensor histidine kinase KdpD [Anaeromyxobacteraceae bacterium]
MATVAERPDPDALLRRLQEEERQARRGRLKIFFGFAPGVGKTYRMLQVARELVTQRHDVVVGAVETHGRYDTASLVLGLELLPRRTLPYRGRVLEEFDLDAALARRPALLLLDEMAHTNAPGSRHAKRWQDAMELLEAGIDVHTTLNVQHIESLNDVVEQITHVQVRETVPDSVLERADEIELVDIAPEELLQRLRDGKVYLPEQAARAVQHFFQRGNLLALRELALRRMADRVDADVQAYREEQGVQTTWATAERILVCVGPSPGAARLVRAAARMAAGLRAAWVAATVEQTGKAPLGDEDRERLDGHLRLADALGAETARLSGPSVAGALLAFARKHNVTRIVIGKPGRSRWREILRGSVLDEVVRGSGDIDLHVISGEEDAEREPRAPGEPAPPAAWPYAWSALLVAATTGLAAVASSVLGVPDPQMLYLVAVMVAAIWFGRGPSILAAALSVAAYDFFFVPPPYTFAVADARYVLTFAMMFGVGIVVSSLALRLRRAEQAAVLREERTAALHTLGRELGSALHLEAVAAVSAGRGAVTFDTPVAVLIPDEQGLAVRAVSPSGFALGAAELAVARWTLEHGRLAGSGTDTLPGSAVTCVPLRLGSQTLGVLAVRPRAPGPLTTEQRDVLAAFARQVAFALERVRLAEQARQAALRARTEELRSSLLSSVSHDLRTPIAAITGAATTLRSEAGLDERVRRDLLEAVCEEAERLERLVGNLLDMTRLESGTVSPKREWVPLEEIVGTALGRVEKLLGRRNVATTIPAGFPLLSVDPVLLEQLLVNLLENAARYAGAEAGIEIRAEQEGGSLVIEVADRGPGISPGDEERIFERFQRGEHAGVAGAGLGLAIARAIAQVHGGRLTAANRPGGGAVFRLTLPAPEQPPLAPAGLAPAEGVP